MSKQKDRLLVWRYSFRRKHKRLIMMLLILFVVPLATGAMLGFEMSSNRIEGIPTVIVDHDQSEFSRNLAGLVEASQVFEIIGYVGSDQEIEEQIARGGAYVGMILPEGLSADVRTGMAPSILIFYDGTSMPVASTARAGMAEILQTARGAYLKTVQEAKLNVAPSESIKRVQPIDATYRILYNPARNYRNFFLPGLLTAVIQVGIVIVGFQRAKESEAGFVASIRKIIQTGLLGTLSIALVMGVQVHSFGMPFRGDLTAFVVLTVLFSTCMAGFGYLFGRLIPDKVLGTQMACVCVLPAAVLGGYTFPLMAMPMFFQRFSRLIPLAYYGEDLRNLTLKPMGFSQLVPDMLYFVIFLSLELLILFVGGMVFKRFSRESINEGIYS